MWLSQTSDPKWEDIRKDDGNSAMTRQVRTSSALLFVIYDPRRRAPASENDFLGSISLGCVMENMWLMASALGIGVQIVSSLSGDEASDEIKRMLTIPAHFGIAFTMRLGYPANEMGGLRVRRELEDFAHHNRFTNALR